jgi:hypothetical protein
MFHYRMTRKQQQVSVEDLYVYSRDYYAYKENG